MDEATTPEHSAGDMPGTHETASLREVVDDLITLVPLLRNHEQDVGKLRQQVAVQVAKLEDLGARCETGIQQAGEQTARVLRETLTQEIAQLRTATAEALGEVTRQQTDAAEYVRQQAFRLGQAGHWLPWKFTAAVILAVVLGLGSIGGYVIYHLWRDNRNLRRHEALVYGLDRYFLDTHYRELSADQRRVVDQIYTRAGHLPPDAQKRRAAQAVR